ncbi:MAG TPA: hypothetical protein VHO84_08420, partial [Syntrophorhabdaceae bacterium]|nr:hypothetical protein [Syntrophorhabdaceae bacterium]
IAPPKEVQNPQDGIPIIAPASIKSLINPLSSAAETKAFIDVELKKWSDIIKKAKIDFKE